ncbi:hypothetical protein Osc7112_4916 [Oscillatoria nigro-viridis PCC 7112]|uniref:Uncharacterized protein n=1 Tax=Phormidium nigroviride PCC 7112 TaxID=179408 RepID=K9VNQ2_9CYAN|nr:hypothetical protein [Oscillatoria nigro-viridis]AFZ09184.1 hypothetical protein Osc7112_4916 [Oscillatoria nigro-viridis PCC 7112]
MTHIEIKSLQNIYPRDARKIIDKQTVVAVITTGTISPDAKELFNQAGIAWAEKVPESEFMESEAKEEG